jgi:RNA polymerase subunit RPABC4/transcription elongation factor Spt4
MHYCQVCDDPHLMVPEDGVARCPVCGSTDQTAATRPLFVVTGASASGKTTIFPELLRCLAGRCLVFDVDWLIDPLGRAAKDGEIDWAAFRDAWLYVAHGVAQNGLPTLLLGPFIPEHLEGLPGRSGVGEIHYLVLDCPDDLRRQRIEARPAWRSRDIGAQTEFGRWLRKNLAPVIDTSVHSPAEVAMEVAGWAQERIAAPDSQPRTPAKTPAKTPARTPDRS